MNPILNIFKDITNIPRCSGNHEPFIAYIKEFAKEYDYKCLIDDTFNILCKKENSNAKLSLQSHYDMVCLEDNCTPILVEDEYTITAKSSTLGADNGIGCSYMLYLMTKGYDCEFLFTSDEEIGLIGANNLELDLKSEFMLNLDSEEEGEICIGCAGGVDVFGKNFNKQIIKNKDNLDLYEVSISGLQGGHSGVDIDKNIPNAIKLIGKTIKEANAKLLELNAGERINSIPVNAKAIIACHDQPSSSHKNMKIKKIETKCEHLNVFDDKIIDFIYTFADGVRAYNKELGFVLNSINLAKVTTTVDYLEVELSARSMENSELVRLKDETVVLLQNHGFEVTTDGKYPAWKPDINEFTNIVLETYQHYNEDASLEAIHAGLECAIFKDKYPHINIASIGPTIKFPHSVKEQVNKKSVENVFKVVEKIVKRYTK